MANKKHCPGCCSGCHHNCYAQADCTGGGSSRGGCGHHHGCSSCGHHHGCGSCSSCSSCNGCGNSCNRSSNGFGTLRSVTGPFSNCGNWWSNNECFPYYTGPCGPCEPCGHCCCKEWPWPWPPVYPVMPIRHDEYAPHSDCAAHVAKHCDDTEDTNYTCRKNCYQTEASARDVWQSRHVKPIVDCSSVKHSCGCD